MGKPPWPLSVILTEHGKVFVLALLVTPQRGASSNRATLEAPSWTTLLTVLSS